MINENVQRYDSPYTYLENIKMQTQTVPKWQADLEKMFKDNVYGKVEYLVLEALYVYHYMNNFNITRYLDLKLQNRKWRNYQNIINRLQSDNVICKNTYGNTVFYSLFPKAREYMLKRIPPKRTGATYAPQETTEGILECAALAQWHLGVLHIRRIREHSFYRKVKMAKTTVKIPSYIDCTIGAYHYKVISMAFPKNRAQNIEPFFKDLLEIWHMVEKTAGRNQITLTILVISSLKEIEAITQLLNTLPEAQNRTIYYSLEGNATEFTGLSCLYYYEKSTTATQDSIKVIHIRE